MGALRDDTITEHYTMQDLAEVIFTGPETSGQRSQ